jgi:ABC-type lipoprotein release transport system permease subunit
VPETIRKDKFEVELMEALSLEDREVVAMAYEYVEVLGAYLLKETRGTERQNLELVLDAMVRCGFSGAIRHINQVIDVVVVGIINSPAPLPNGNTAFIPLDILQDEAGMLLNGAVTELVIRKKDALFHQIPGESESSKTIKKALQNNLNEMGVNFPENLDIRTWEDYMQEYLGYEQVETVAANALTVLLFILSFIGISNTILMAILERTKETGMLRALGMTNGQVITLYMLEGGFLGFIGSIFGILLGCLLNYPMVKYGIDFSAMAAVMDGSIGYRTTGLFISTWDIPLIIITGLVATLLSAFMAFFPIRKALKTQITDNLRFE